jgi:hypothetical protein
VINFKFNFYKIFYHGGLLMVKLMKKLLFNQIRNINAFFSIFFGNFASIKVAPDVGHVARDAGHVARDVGHVARDVGHVTPDVGHVAPDAGHVAPDAGHVARDAEHVARDAIMSAFNFNPVNNVINFKFNFYKIFYHGGHSLF